MYCRCIYLKSWWLQNIQAHKFHWKMLPKKCPTLRQLSPRRDLRDFKQHLWFTAFHHFLFEYCGIFHYDMTGFAMQMQVRCFLRRSTHIFVVFVSHPCKNGCHIQIILQALLNRVSDVFMYSKRPSGHHKGPTNDWQVLKTHTNVEDISFSLFFDLWLHVGSCHNNPTEIWQYVLLDESCGNAYL